MELTTKFNLEKAVNSIPILVLYVPNITISQSYKNMHLRLVKFTPLHLLLTNSFQTKALSLTLKSNIFTKITKQLTLINVNF